MAIKHFLATCEKKVSKHPVKDGQSLSVPVMATTQSDAKSVVRTIVNKRDLELAASEFTYNDWYKSPQLQSITEEEYNAEKLAFEGDQSTNYPTLNDSGYYDDTHEHTEISQFIYTNNGHEFNGAKVFILKVADNQWSYGFKLSSANSEKYEPMTEDKIEDTRDSAIDKGIGRLERFIDYHDEYGPEEDKPFVFALLGHDFYAGFSDKTKHEDQLEITISEKTDATKKRLEEIFNKPAANDSILEPTVKKSVMNITDSIHVVIAVTNLGDEGYAYGFEVNSRTDRLAGDNNTISEERFITEREAVKHAGQVISDCLASYDTSLTLYKTFAQSKYIDYFDENAIIMGEQEDPIKAAIRKRFEARPTAQASEAEINYAYDEINSRITEHTDIEALVEAIQNTQKCNEMYMSPQVDQLIEQCTTPPAKLNTVIYKAVQQRLKKAGIATEDNLMTAHDYIAPNITDKTDVEKLCNMIIDLKNPHNLLIPANACLLAMKCETEKSDKKQIPWDCDDEYQIFISNCLASNDVHLNYSSKQYAEMGKRLEQVVNEFSIDKQFDKKSTLNNIENNEWASGDECAVDFMNVRALRALFRENLETTASNEVEIKSTYNETTSEHIMEIGKNNFPYDSYEFHLDHLLKMNVAASLMGVGVFRRYVEVLKNAYAHVDEKFDMQDSLGMARSVIACFTVLGGNPEDKGIILDFLSDQEKLNKRFELIKKTTGCLDPQTHLKAQLKAIAEQKKENQEVSIEQAKSKNLPAETAPQNHRQDTNEHTTDSDNTDSAISDHIVEKEPANEPLVEVTTIADLPADYQKNPNLKLWMQGFKTDLQHVKPDQNGRLSIKTQYRLMKATEIWGPIGVGWGYKVLREWIDTGAPIVMNGDITQHFEQIHKIEIEFWYLHEGEKVSFTQYGDTRKLYLARGGYFVHDDEVEKKSLSDALGKAMSMTGICADIYLGTYDGDTLINKTEQIQLANRQLKQLEFDAQTAELAINKAKSYTDKFSTAPSMAEIKRLEKLAITALEAYPTPDEDSKRKKSKAIGAIATQAQNAISDFNKDLNKQEQANG